MRRRSAIALALMSFLASCGGDGITVPSVTVPEVSIDTIVCPVLERVAGDTADDLAALDEAQESGDIDTFRQRFDAVAASIESRIDQVASTVDSLPDVAMFASLRERITDRIDQARAALALARERVDQADDTSELPDLSGIDLSTFEEVAGCGSL